MTSKEPRGKITLNSDIEETLKRIQDSNNVIGLVVINEEGFPIKSSLDSTLTVQYTSLIKGLSSQAMSLVRALDPSNKLEYFRIRGKKHEIMVAPEKEFTLFVIQNPSELSKD